MIVRVETDTFRDHTVRAGYEYDDQTNEITGYWCENDTGLPLTMKLPDAKGSKTLEAVKFDSGEKVEAGKLDVLEEKDGVKSAPDGIQMVYAWRAVR